MIRRFAIVAALVVISAATMTGCMRTMPEATLTPIAHPQATVAAGAAKPFADMVPVSRPTHLSFPAARIDGPVEEYTAAQADADGGINPATLETIAWYTGIADSVPGTNSTNTVYIFGHTWVEPAVFNGLTAVSIGDEATLQTETGTLIYQVHEIVNMHKDEFSSNPTVSAIVPGRLILVTCHRPAGWSDDEAAPDNTAVVLELVGGRAG